MDSIDNAFLRVLIWLLDRVCLGRSVCNIPSQPCHMLFMVEEAVGLFWWWLLLESWGECEKVIYYPYEGD